MKFSIPFVACLGLAAAQQSTVDVIVQQLKNAINATQILTAAIESFTGLAQAVDLLTANTAVLTTLNNGTDVILTLDQLLLSNSLTLPPYVIQLRALTNQSIGAIISKQPVFVNNSLGPTVYMSLQQINCASTRFTNASNSRLPGGGINAASDQLSAPILESFQIGLRAYAQYGDNSSTPYNCSFVNGTSRGLNAADQTSGAGMLSSSNGLTVVVAAALAGLMMI